jgi:hypothetical protein
MKKIFVEFVPGLVAGAVGGVVGYFVFKWLLGYALFAPVLPGALCGLACGLLSRSESNIRGILCAIEAAASGLIAYWIAMIPRFETDGTFQDFVMKVPKLEIPTLLMLALGVGLGFWWGRESTLSGWKYKNKPATPTP